MKAHRRTMFLVACACIGLAACVRSPVVDLTGVRLGGIGLRGVTLVAELNIANPNRFAIETDSITFTLEANDPGQAGSWSRVTSGTDVQRVRVEKNSDTRVDIPIRFAYSGLATPVRALLEGGMFDYRLTGRVFVRKPLPKKVPFSEEGRLSVGAGAQ